MRWIKTKFARGMYLSMAYLALSQIFDGILRPSACVFGLHALFDEPFKVSQKDVAPIAEKSADTLSA
jgi:hypothetical protein